MLALASTMLSACSHWFWHQQEDSDLVPFAIISSSASQRWLKTGRDQDQSVWCALIRSQSEWDDWFQSAPTMRGNLRYASRLTPAADYFESKQLLLVARMIPAPNSAERAHVFVVEKITMKEGALKLIYRFNQPLSGATYKVKDFLLVAIPKKNDSTGPIQFIENNEAVCVIAR